MQMWFSRCFTFVSIESLWTVAGSLRYRQPWLSWTSSLQRMNCGDRMWSFPVYESWVYLLSYFYLLLQIPKMRLMELPLCWYSPLLGILPSPPLSHCTCLPGDPFFSFQLKSNVTLPFVWEYFSAFPRVSSSILYSHSSWSCILYIFSLMCHSFPRPFSWVQTLTFSSLLTPHGSLSGISNSPSTDLRSS